MTAAEAYRAVCLDAEREIEAVESDAAMHYRNEELERQSHRVRGAWEVALEMGGADMERPTDWWRRLDAKVNGKAAA